MSRDGHARGWAPGGSVAEAALDTRSRQVPPARASSIAEPPLRRRDPAPGARAGALAFEHAAAPIAILSGSGRIIAANHALARLAGRSGADLRGADLRDLLRGPGAAATLAAVRDVGAGRRREARVETSLGRHDRDIDVAVTVRAASPDAPPAADARRDADGADPAAVTVITLEDLTACREAQRRLRELETELGHVARLALAGELSAALAHEINQPLAAIANYTQAAYLRLSREGDCPPGVLDHLRAADAEARRAGSIVRSLAAFVRKRECKRRPTSLGELVRQSEGLIQAAAASSHTPVVIDIDDGAAPVMVDSVQVQQVILNLVKNAAEATESGPGPAPRPITVRVWRPGPEEVEIAVTDCGCGLPPATPERVFSPFFTTKPHGMGLGLTICRSIIEAHGGRLWGENNPPPDAGATFRFRLPLSQGDPSYDG